MEQLSILCSVCAPVKNGCRKIFSTAEMLFEAILVILFSSSYFVVITRSVLRLSISGH